MYNGFAMIQIEIGKNEGNQRLDKFLRKYLNRAPLSFIYKAIRKDVRVNGRRKGKAYLLQCGDVLSLYIQEKELREFRMVKSHVRPKRSFRIVYEDDDLLIAGKPAGLLTHGDQREKKNHLTNQVIDYLIDSGSFDPGKEKTFVPAPVNRLDRNTSGLVIFCKNYAALQTFNRLIRDGGSIRKRYLTILWGRMTEPRILRGRMTKTEAHNIVHVENDPEAGKEMVTKVTPLLWNTPEQKNGAWTLAEIELKTGRTHQIRVQTGACGHPVLGDRKYGSPEECRIAKEKFGKTTQLLHAYRLDFRNMPESCAALEGRSVIMTPPRRFKEIAYEVFGSGGLERIENITNGKE